MGQAVSGSADVSLRAVALSSVTALRSEADSQSKSLPRTKSRRPLSASRTVKLRGLLIGHRKHIQAQAGLQIIGVLRLRLSFASEWKDCVQDDTARVGAEETPRD